MSSIPFSATMVYDFPIRKYYTGKETVTSRNVVSKSPEMLS